MLTKMEKKAPGVLFTVTVILIIFYLCFGVLYPDAGVVQYTPETPEKTHVTYEGIILESKITSTGGHVLLDVSGVTVFVEGGADNIFYKTGDRIRVTGIVETYGSSKEISVGPSGSILIIE